MSIQRLAPAALLCASVILVAACQNLPRYKAGGGKFDQWKEYDSSVFEPSTGTVTAVDLRANTVTITHRKGDRVYAVTPETRIIHQGDRVTLAQLPLNIEVRYTVTGPGLQLRTLWYGHLINQSQQRAVTVHKEENSFYQ